MKIGIFCFLLMILSCTNNKMQYPFAKEYIHPVKGFSKSVTVLSNHIKTIYISGLTGDGIDLEAQTRAAFNNIKAELEASGATFKDIVKMNTYIVHLKPEYVDTFRSIRKEILGETNMPASTIVGVQALAGSDKRIEIEAIAIVQWKK